MCLVTECQCALIKVIILDALFSFFFSFLSFFLKVFVLHVIHACKHSKAISTFPFFSKRISSCIRRKCHDTYDSKTAISTSFYECLRNCLCMHLLRQLRSLTPQKNNNTSRRKVQGSSETNCMSREESQNVLMRGGNKWNMPRERFAH